MHDHTPLPPRTLCIRCQHGTKSPMGHVRPEPKLVSVNQLYCMWANGPKFGLVTEQGCGKAVVFFVCLFFLLEAESQSLAPKKARNKDPLHMRGQNSRTWGGPSECFYVLLSLLYNICHSLTTNLVVLWLLHLPLLSSMRADAISFVL